MLWSRQQAVGSEWMQINFGFESDIKLTLHEGFYQRRS